MPTAWRIVKRRYADSAFDGEGARLHGGRWTPAGAPVVHASESIALAVLEILVHLGNASVLPYYRLFPVSFRQEQVSRLDRGELPDHWRQLPPPPDLQGLGERWLAAGASLVLEVPSAIVPRESNYLIDPAHPQAGSLDIGPPEPFELDVRFRGSRR